MALIGLSTLFTLLLLEFALRFWVSVLATPEQRTRYALFTNLPEDSWQWAPHPYLSYYPRPGFRRELLSHNSLGYRGPEIEPDKPDGVYRIVALGGSTTYTTGIQDNNLTYTALLQKVLGETYGHERVEVINAGAGGYSSWESLANLQFRVLALDPDLVLVYHGVNDVHSRLVDPATYRSDNTGRRTAWASPRVPLAHRSQIVRFATRRLGYGQQVGLGGFVDAPSYRGARSAGWDTQKNERVKLLDRNPPVYYERNLNAMASLAAAQGVDIVFATFAQSPEFESYANTLAYRRGIEEHNEIVRGLGSKPGVQVFDFAAVMPADPVYWRDGLHVTEQGAALKAEHFARFIHDAGLIQARRQGRD
jgi:lysophospholipase L1-like esterase